MPGSDDETTIQDDNDDDDDDETLLESIDPSTLQNLCEQYALPTTGTKPEILQRLRDYAGEQAGLDMQRRRGRTKQVETSLEGKARHEIIPDEQIEEGLEDGMEET